MLLVSKSPLTRFLNRFVISSCFLTSLVILSVGCQSGAGKPPKAPGYTLLNSISDSDLNRNQAKVNEVLQRAYSQAGRPYRYGGNTPETGFDCSGFVRWVYNPLGVELPRRSRDMLKTGSPVPLDELKPGDLVFFNSGYSHVGIYTGHGTYIHSPRTGKRIQESQLFPKGRGNKIVGARRIIDNHNATAPEPALKETWLAQAVTIHSSIPVVTKGKRNGRRAASPARAAAPKKTAAAAKSQVHKVSQGDTLYVLAQKHGLTTAELKKANNMAGKKNLIKPGQKLIIPAKTAPRAS